MKNANVFPLAVALVALALGGCGRKDGGAAGGEVIKIGHVAPLSGGITHLGKDNENGARLAAEEINAAGGVKIGDKTYPIEILAEDDKADPREATLVAQKLVDAGAIAVVGHLNSGCSVPASKIYSDASIAQVSPSSTAIKYTHQGYKTTFRVVANDAQQGAAMGNYAIDGLHVKTAAVVDDRTQYGGGLAEEVAKTLESRGVKIVARDFTNDKATDFSAILTKIRATRPDVVVYGGMDATAGPMARQLHQLGITAPFLSGDGACTPEFINLAGEGASGLSCTRAGENVEQLARGMDFVKKYKARFGTEVQIYSPYSYDAVYLIVAAIRRAGALDRARVAGEVAKTDLDGLTGHIVFDANGDLKNGAISVFQVQGGHLQHVTTSR
jgi:branched-chain amino acid transport system substrate-binding protein